MSPRLLFLLSTLCANHGFSRDRDRLDAHRAATGLPGRGVRAVDVVGSFPLGSRPAP